MPRKIPRSEDRTEMGRELARRLYDYRLARLVNLGAAERASLQGEFPGLREAEFNYVLEQVIAAKRYEQERIGWQAISHDAAVLTIVAVTWLTDVRSGMIAGVAVLVLLESLLQFYFDRRLYRYLGALVWLTYPAYAVLAYLLYRRGTELAWIAAAVAFTWGGTFLLGILARLPVRLVLEAKARAAQEAARLKQR